MPVLLLAIAGAMAAEPWAGTRSWPTVNAASSAAGDDGFAKSATQTLETLSVAKVVRGGPSGRKDEVHTFAGKQSPAFCYCQAA